MAVRLVHWPRIVTEGDENNNRILLRNKNAKRKFAKTKQLGTQFNGNPNDKPQSNSYYTFTMTHNQREIKEYESLLDQSYIYRPAAK